MEYQKLLTNLDLKLSMDVVFTISSGREFHSLIVCGKKENLKRSFFALGTTNVKAWLSRVLLSLFGFRWAATEKSVRLWESLYIKDSQHR